MSINPNDPAFPRIGEFAGYGREYENEPGLTIRAHIATQCGAEAMAILNDYYGDDWKGSCLADAISELVKTQLHIADALIAELNKGGGE